MTNRLLETDVDDPALNVDRLAGESGIPGVTIEREGNHWNVYKEYLSLAQGAVVKNLGEIYYVEPPEGVQTTPELSAYLKQNPWQPLPNSPYIEDPPSCSNLRAAIEYLVKKAESWMPMAESEADDGFDVEADVKRLSGEPSITITSKNPPGRWRVEMTFSEPRRRMVGGELTVDSRKQPTVSFYDLKHAGAPGRSADGQYVASYYAATLMERANTGIDLYGSVPSWKIDAEGMSVVRKWIKDTVEDLYGYKLTGAPPFGLTYESEEPDPVDSEFYTKPQLYTKQPVAERLESGLRVLFGSHYDEVKILRQPDRFGVAMGLSEAWTWTVSCTRKVPLPLSPGAGDWWKTVKKWISDWAHKNELGFLPSSFKHYGRLRTDPTFTFRTWAIWKRPKTESLEDEMSPELVMKDLAGKVDWAEQRLCPALWQFHSRGVGYTAIGSASMVFINVALYFEPDKDNFAARLKEFVKNWLEDNKLMKVNEIHMYSAAETSVKSYPRWTLFVVVNSSWSPGWPEHVPVTSEVGNPGA